MAKCWGIDCDNETDEGIYCAFCIVMTTEVEKQLAEKYGRRVQCSKCKEWFRTKHRWETKCPEHRQYG